MGRGRCATPDSGGDGVIRLQGRTFQGLAETPGIRSAQNQGGHKDGQNYSVAVHDEVAPFQAFRQCASRKDQKNRPDNRYGCQRAVKEGAVVFGGSSHVNLLKRWFDSGVQWM